MTNKFQIFNRRCKRKLNRNKIANWDDYVIGECDELIATGALSTCLAITLYNPPNKRGILAHITGFDYHKDALKPNTTVDTLLKHLNCFGNIDYTKLEVTLSGEGWLPINSKRRKSLIVRERINYYGIPIIGEDLCCPYARDVLLDCNTGNVKVYRIS